MHPHLYWIPVLVIAGAIFLYIMFKRSRRERPAGRPDATDPSHLERDDDPVRRRAMSKGPNRSP